MGRILIALALVAGIAGCGRIADSRVNPLTWFGGSQGAPAVAAPELAQDGRPLIAVIETLDIAPTPSGAILRVTGVAASQGYWEGALVPVEDGDPTVLTYAFRAEPPLAPTRVSTERSREVTVAVELSAAMLQGVREIRVTGQQNARTARR